MLPTLSIVMPSFRQARYLGPAMASVLRQKADVHEYFVMDGGSDDGSVDIIRGHEAQLTGWVSAKDGGQGDAINRGFAQCSGEVLGWLNSDDLYLPGALAAVRQAFARDPGLDFLTGWTLWTDEHACVVRAKRRSAGSLAQARAGLPAHQPSCFFRRSLFETAGPVDTSLWMTLDTDLFMRMFRTARSVRCLPRYLSVCRGQPEAKTKLRDQGKLADLCAREERLLDERFPQWRAPSLGSRCRRLLWRMRFNLCDKAGEKRDTRQWRGRPVDEIFPWG